MKFITLLNGGNHQKNKSIDEQTGHHRVFLNGRRRLSNCSGDVVNKRHPTRQLYSVITDSSDVSSGRHHPVPDRDGQPSPSYILSGESANIFAERGHKRCLEGRTDSPAKKSRENFNNLLKFWDGNLKQSRATHSNSILMSLNDATHPADAISDENITNSEDYNMTSANFDEQIC
jgi:hypothetical protein